MLYLSHLWFFLTCELDYDIVQVNTREQRVAVSKCVFKVVNTLTKTHAGCLKSRWAHFIKVQQQNQTRRVLVQWHVKNNLHVKSIMGISTIFKIIPLLYMLIIMLNEAQFVQSKVHTSQKHWSSTVSLVIFKCLAPTMMWLSVYRPCF